MKQYETVKFVQISECQAPLHKCKAPLWKTSWWWFCCDTKLFISQVFGNNG